MTSSKRANVSGPGCKRLTILVVLAAFANATIEWMISYVTCASRPVDISSAHATGAAPCIISPTVTRRRCPPLTPRTLSFPTKVSAQTARSRPLMVRFSVNAASSSVFVFPVPLRSPLPPCGMAVSVPASVDVVSTFVGLLGLDPEGPAPSAAPVRHLNAKSNVSRTVRYGA